MYAAKQIAQYIITKCTEYQKPVSNLKLQKMLYFIWIDYYKETGKHLFKDDICAWKFGIVCPDVYYEYCSYGGMDIDSIFDCSPLTPDDKKILDKRISYYNNISVSTLVDLTHQRGKPWDEIYNVRGCHRDRIPFDLIERLEC